MTHTYKAGERFDVQYPFTRTTFDEWDGDGLRAVATWKVGPVFEDVGEGDVTAFADALGTMVLTVISTHKPGRFPARVFFTRTWVSPEGKAFGKNRLHITTPAAFSRYTQNYQHEYALRGCDCDGCKWPTTDHRKKGWTKTGEIA